MSYTETRELFGDFTKVTITHDGSGARMVVIPEAGARLNSYIVPVSGGELDIIDGYETPEELIVEDHAKSSLLAPFPNRIADGAYSFEGAEYQLPINKADEHNAIHGFLSGTAFAVRSSHELGDAHELILQHECDGTEGFPFPCSIEVVYMFEGSSLSVRTNITNIGEGDMPVGFGWHPYVKTGHRVDELALTLSEVERVHVDRRLVPTGKLSVYDTFRTQKAISVTVFDTGFHFTTADKNVELSDPASGVSIGVTCGDGYDYVQLFTPPWRTSMAIEPMTCAANAFNNGMGLKVLAPGESFSATFKVAVST